MNLKLIGGKFGSRLLKSPKGLKTRPTSAILRKAVFDISSTYIAESHFLDLFAGSGAMGIEALSRGASKATFVERDRNAWRCIQENLHLLGLDKQSAVFCADALTILKKFVQSKKIFDIIYIDPPYSATFIPSILQTIEEGALLQKDGHLFVEEAFPSQLNPASLQLKHLQLIDSRKFGHSLLHHYIFKDTGS